MQTPQMEVHSQSNEPLTGSCCYIPIRFEGSERIIQESDKRVPCGCCFGATPPYLNPAIIAVVGGVFLEAAALFILFYLITEEGRYFVIMNVVFHSTAALWLVAGLLHIYRQLRARISIGDSKEDFDLGDPSCHPLYHKPQILTQQAKRTPLPNKYSVLYRPDIRLTILSEDSETTQTDASVSSTATNETKLETNTPSYSSIDAVVIKDDRSCQIF